MRTEVKKLPKSEIEIEFELTAEEFQKHVEHAISHLKQHVKVDGFRQGHVPESIVKEKIGKENLLMEAGDHAVKHVYSNYIRQLAEENKLEPIGQPEIQILKIAEGNPLLFKAKITILSDIDLPDYKEIAKKIKGREISVSEDEIKDALNYLQKSRAKFTLKNPSAGSGQVEAGKGDFVQIEYQNKDIENNKVVKDQFILGEGGFMKGFEENVMGMKAGEEKEFPAKFPETSPRKDLAGKESVFKVKVVSVQKMELPEISDEFAKQLGGFDTLVALKVNIKEGITAEKTEAEKQRKRGEILEKISEKVSVELPEKLVEHEKERALEDLKQRITGNLKITFEDYLASIKQTEEGLKQTYQKEAEKRLKNFLILRQLGKEENIEVSPAEVDEEVSRAIKNYSKEQLAKFDIEQFKEYTKGVIQNEKIFQILEKLFQ